MNIIPKLFHAVIKRIGNTKTKQAVWDVEFIKGKWDNIKHTQSDIIYKYVEKYANKGVILDLGSGSGNTGMELNIHAYKEYIGVDISTEAINIANERVNRILERKNKNSYFVGDIEKYVPMKNVDVILFRESIYYVRIGRIIYVIDRQMKYLNSGGVVIVRIHDSEKHINIINKIISRYNILEREDNEDKTVVLIFN